ncbi:RHS repeat-associated core domain-containing protein [Paenibacillus tritici]|nr:RHS repeat-associated core domain-containing protein [Paenibacillus tritici]
MMFFLPAASAETLQDQLNNLVGPKQKYNTMLSPAYLRTNETVDEISPQSGSLSITQTDYVLPGKNGLDLEFKRIYKNEAANVQEMEVNYVDGAWVDRAFSYAKTSSFYEDRYNLGMGMRFSFPSIEVKVNSDGSSHKFLHTDSGDVYRLKPANLEGAYVFLPEGQTVKDVVVREATAYQNGQEGGTSKYKMTGKDGKNTYFSEDGRILGIVDRYGNTINFQYDTLSYSIDGHSITKKLISKITDSVGRDTTIEYKEDFNYKVGPIGVDAPVSANNYYTASQSPNNTDSGDLKGKFQVILHLPGDKSIVYDKSAALVNDSKRVIRTRLQRVYDTDAKPKYMFWYEQPDLGFTYFNKDKYSAYSRYENLVLVDEVKSNKAKSYVYNTYTKRLNEGSMQYRKVFESSDLIKKGFDAAKPNLLDKFITDTYNKKTYTYTNEADGYGTADYKQDDKAYLKDTYRYYTTLTDVNGSTVKYTYNGNQEMIQTEKLGKNHKETVTSEHDELKLVKKQETLVYQVANGQATGEPVHKIENYRYDEYGNMTSYTGPIADRDSKGYPVNNEHTVLYTYDINKFHILTQKTWKLDQNTTAQTNYQLDSKGNVLKESKANDDPVNPWLITDYAYDTFGNLIRKTAHDSSQDFTTYYEYGIDANGTNTKGAYLTKQYQQSGGKTYAKTYAYDMHTGNILSEIDANGNKTSYQYDAVGRVLKNIRPDNKSLQYEYLESPYANFKIQYTDAGNYKYLNEYDILGNLLNSKIWQDNAWLTTLIRQYDSFANLIKEVDANGHSARYSYDSNQNVVEKSYYAKDQTLKGKLALQYQNNNDPLMPLMLTITDEEGYDKRSYYDPLGQMVKREITPDHQKFYTSTASFDYAGNILSESDQKQNTTRYTYDSQGRKTSQTDAMGNTTEYTYNILGQVVNEKAPGGKITEWTYDNLGRNTVKKIIQSGSADYYYTRNEFDAVNNLVKTTVGAFLSGVNQDSSIISYVYDSQNRISDEYSKLTESSSTHIHYDYDANGNKTKVVEYGDSIGNRLIVRNFQYDFAGRPILESGVSNEKAGDGKIVERGQFETKYVYDLAGNLLKKQIFNGTSYDTEENTYTYRNLIATTKSPFNAKGARQKRFDYDKVGNLVAETSIISGTERTTSYTYDGMALKTSVTDPLGNTTRYQYDPAGNVVKMVDARYYTQSVAEAPGIEKEYDALNRLVKTTAFDGTTKEVVDYKEYDGRGNPIKQADGEGYNTENPAKSIGAEYRYNVLDKPVLVVSAQIAYLNQQQGTSHFTKSLSYDGSGNVLIETTGPGNTARFSYDLGGRLQQLTYPDGSTVKKEYDLTGKWVINSIDQLGHVTKTYNNIFEKPYLIEYADGTKEMFKYSSKGELLESVNKEGNSTYYSYDLAGNQISEKSFINKDGTYNNYRLTRVDYDEASNIMVKESFLSKTNKASGAVSESSADNRMEQIFDKAGRLIVIKGPFGRESKSDYDRSGNVIASYQKVSDANYDITRYSYDLRGRLNRSTLLVKTADISSEYLAGAEFDNEYVDRLHVITSYSYYKNDQIKSKTDPKGNKTLFEYDYDKLMVKKTDALQGISIYQYDSNGNLIAETNPNGVATLYEYDALKRLLRKIAPSSDGERAITRYVYDLAGNLTREVSPNQYSSEKDKNGQLAQLKGMSYTYDTMNRRISKISPEGIGLEYILYNLNGQVAKVVDGLRYNGNLKTSKGTTYAYDGLGRMVNETNALGVSKQYEYSVLDNLVKQTDGRGNSTFYNVNSDGTIAQVSNPDGGVVKYEYDKLGRKILETSPLGATTVYSYNAFGKEKSIKDPYGYSIEKKYDLNSNQVSEKDKRGSLSLYSYDSMDRLTVKKIPLEMDSSKNIVYLSEQYKYDSLGNLLKKMITGSKDDSPKRETTYTYYDNNLVQNIADNSGANTVKKYDKNGNMIRQENLRLDGLADVQEFEFDSENRLTQKTNWLDEESVGEASYLLNVATLRATDMPGKIRQTTGYVYDILGNKVQDINPRAYGYLETDTTNRKLYTSYYTYDILNRPEKFVRYKGTTAVYKQYGYDEAGNKITSRDERGGVTHYQYDAANRVAVTTNTKDKEFVFQYDLAGNKVQEENSKGYTISYTYDKLNRLVLTKDPEGTVISKNIYDANSNITKKIDAKGYAAGSEDNSQYGNVYQYDLANRLIAFIDPELAAQNGNSKFTTKYQYNIYGDMVSQADALGNLMQYEYNNAGHLIKVIDGEQVEVTYGYDRIGNKLFMKDGRGKLTQYRYGSFGVQQSVTDASNQSIGYKYDLALNKILMTDQMMRDTTYEYDNFNHLIETKVSQTGDKVLYGYDEAGNRIRMTDESGVSTYIYDSENLLLEMSKDGKKQISYTYDDIGNIDTITDALGYVTTYHYDKSSRMNQVTYDGHTTAYTYDLNGNRAAVQYEDGVREVFGYDRNNRLLTVINKRKNGSEISGYRYTYDEAGRQETESDSYGTTKYKYDQAGRILQIEAPGKTTVYAYDGAGNRKSMLETYTSMQPSSYKNTITQQAIEFKLKKAEYLYSSSNQLLKLEERMNGADGKEVLLKTVDYLYDAGGNELSQRTSYIQPHSADLHQSTGGETYEAGELQKTNRYIEKVSRTYDGFNRLKKAVTVKSGDRSEIEFMYNGDGLRTQKTVRSTKTPDVDKETHYVYDRQHVILELDSSGKLSTRYIRGINYIARMDQAEKYTYYLYNGHGDVVQTVTASGEVQNQYDYDVFGNRTLTIELYVESIQYGGEFYDAESGLYYLRARYYDPYTARFISEDSYRGEDTNPLSLNLYTYAHNNPILFLDPTGHWAAGDEKLNVEAQAKLIALTNAYYKAVTEAEKKAITAQATTVRTTEGAKDKSVVSPLQFQTAEVTKIVVNGTSKGYATEKEWRQALQKVGIGASDSERKTVGDTFSGGASTINYSTVNMVTIGRTSLTVTVNSSSRTVDSTKKTTDSATASLAMNYKVTANELKFIADTGSYMGSLEKSLYVIDAVKSNKGKVTSNILKDAKLKVAKGPMGTVDMLQFTYDMSEKGFTVGEALKMYKEEVTDPRMAEAYATVTLNLVGSGFSLKRMAQAESKVSVTRTPSKPKLAGIVEGEVKAAGGTGKLSGNFETYFRTMSKADYNTLVQTGKMPATSETFISPTRSFSEGYDGVTIEFKVNAGTTKSLEKIGVRDASDLTKNVYNNMPTVSKGWTSINAYFKGEGDQINIGLGKGNALDTFNSNIIEYKIVGGK